VTKKRSIRKATLLRKTRTGLENPKKADFRPLKRQIRAHIKRLSSVKDPSAKVQSALQSLKQVQRSLSRDCLPTMVLEFP
jgi:hypothetical protein